MPETIIITKDENGNIQTRIMGVVQGEIPRWLISAYLSGYEYFRNIHPKNCGCETEKRHNKISQFIKQTLK